MRILVALFLTSTLLLSSPSSVCAGWPDYAPSYVTAASGGIYMTPAGTGPSFPERGLFLEVYVEDLNHGVLVGFPRQDIWIEAVDRLDLAFCPEGNVADHDTDAQGWTRFSLPLSGGGHSDTGLLVYVGGELISVGGPDNQEYELLVDLNSPDINGDLVVDLSDIALFSQDLVSGYVFRSDFTHDGRLDLADIAWFSQAVGDRCP